MVAAPAAGAQTAAPNSSTPPVISTFAGKGRAGFSGDGGPATAAKLFFPTGVAEDSAGDVYIADTLNNRIRLVRPNGIISTVAGNGIAGYAGDGGPATQAELNSPESPAVNTRGDLFIADSANNRIREVKPNGTITTFAGNGKCGKSGDFGLATQAKLCDPTAVAVAPGGKVFIADSGNNEIRVVDNQGVMTTFAGTGHAGSKGDGGPAIFAQLNMPEGVAFDSLHDLFIADTGNNKVREVTPNGIISTLAGTGTAGYSGDGGKAIVAELNHPEGVGADALGNVYIADTDNFRIRVVIPKGDIFTYAGTGKPGYSGDGGPAIQAKINLVSGDLAIDANNVYFTDTINERVRVIQGGPPPNIPETPWAILLPLSAVVLLGGAFFLVWRRRRLGAAAA
jgi:hypothetical protein